MAESDPDWLSEIALRIGDGESIDSFERTSEPARSPLWLRLQQLSQIAESCRRAQSESPDATEAEGIPAAIGHYDIERCLGRGGVGVVYEALERISQKRVALKVIRPARAADPRAIAWFRREARTLQLLEHPNIAEIYEAGETEDGVHFIAMELVRGQTLDQWAQGRTQDPARCIVELRLRVELFLQICRAIAHAHERQVIHRDLKPTNILVCDGDSAVPSVKVLDFGLAHAAFSTVLTDAKRLQGTLVYMSPEQIEGDLAHIDASTDVYSLGVLFYELLTGALPYDLSVRSLSERARRIRETSPTPLASHWSTRPPRALETMLQRALEKDPAQRPPDMATWIAELARFLAPQRSRAGFDFFRRRRNAT